MISNPWNVPNQFVITDEGRGALGNFIKREQFQSYQSIICERIQWLDGSIVIKLDSKFWNYSNTTGKYRNKFLGEDKKTTEAKIKSGVYLLTNLN